MRRFFILIFFPVTLFSLDVDINLLKQSENAVIEFENYVGPYLFYNSVSEIRNIGSSLASGITQGKKSQSEYSGKYEMFHTPRLEWESSSSCDVFNITENSLVDNIDNVELILSQYLIDLYGYNLDDADLLAKLILIYNAVYRGSNEHYKEVYTSESSILENPEFLGIDTKYYNWPGKSFVFIPLAENVISGDLSNIDSDLFIEEEVIDHIKDKSDDSIALREEIIDFKERQIDEAVEKLQEEENILETKKEELLEVIEEAEEEDKDEIETQIEEIDKELELVEEKKEDLKKSEEKVLDIRDDVAVDKNKDIDKKVELESAVLFLKNRDVSGTMMGQFYKLSDNGDIVASSSLNSVRNNNFIIDRNTVYAISGMESKNHIISLSSVDLATLKNLLVAEVSCYINSPILSIGGFIYTIVEADNEYYIGEFNQDLNFIRRSPQSINKDSYIAFKDGRFYVQGTDYSIRWVNLSDFVSN